MPAFKNLDATQLKFLAQTLAQELKDQPAVIGLSGSLGSGKTTFVKAFAGALGINKISSPTFVIMHEHRHKLVRLYHLDLYRLKHKSDLSVLGLSEIMMHPRNIVLIEWIEKFPSLKKSCDLLIKFKVKPNNLRDVTLQHN
jgi:tRNA threonylcarbamoyladenosine biosynthesis protein TsaE